MKLIALFIGLFLSSSVYSQDLISLRNRKLTPKKEYKLWCFNKRDTAACNYNLFDSMTVTAENGYTYEIKAYKHQEDYDPDMEELDTIVFSKIEIIPHAPLSTSSSADSSSPISFVNEDGWFRFNYWSFNPYFDPREEVGNEFLRSYKVSYDCVAIVLRGWRDAVSPCGFTVIALYKNQAKLVYFEEREITSIVTEGDITKIGLDEPIHDEVEEDLVNRIGHSRIILGNGRIMLMDRYSITRLD